MGCLLLASLVGASGLVIGWVAFPEPAAFRAWWASHGWADKD